MTQTDTKSKLPSAPHIRKARSVQSIMREVCLALVPAALVYVFYLGPGLLIQFILACTFCLMSEYVMLKLRGQPIQQFLSDYSSVVTAVLIAFALPPLTPWWVTASASIFAIVVAKQLYGGLGFNVFNPAMAGYAVVLVSFPGELALWTAPDTAYQQIGLLGTLTTIITGHLPVALSWDLITQATPLDQVQIGLTQGKMLSEILSHSSLSTYGASPWIVFNLAILLGGVWLIVRRIITWHIPVALLGSLFIVALVFRLIDADQYSGPMFQLLSGSTMMAAFFIATDPVSAATSKRGKVYYAIGIGITIYAIRTWGSYPDGVAYAVLLMNMFVPLIDYFTIPRAYGHKR